MIKNKLAFVATSALVGSMLLASSAYAQSTGTTEVEEVVVVGASGPNSVGGAITAETAPKSKSSVTQEFIATQASGQTIIETLNLTPGLNFVNNDPYGSSGGNVRLRGFDGARVSLTFDGMPLNDTGNYAIYTNQQMDGELISGASVNMGTTDVDSPTASATGGTINYVTRKPATEMGGIFTGSVGSFNYGRVFGLLDTGEIGPWGTRAFVAASYQNYDKWKGSGELEKTQYNARIYQPLGDNGDFLSLAFHYNENRNAFYRNITLAQWLADPETENDRSCTLPTPVNGTAQNALTGSAIVRYDGSTGTGSCTSYYELRNNPSNTGNIRGQSKFTLTDNLVLTVDPSFQYVLANGGGFGTFSERDDRLDLGGAVGVDLNGDGDTLDTWALYTPNTTNTRRYGVTSSLIWDLDDNNRIRAAYTYDYGRHRQTGDYGFISMSGKPQNVFGGKDGYGRPVEAIDGANMRGRDRYSVAILSQLAVEYRGQFFDDTVLVSIGVRAPFFKRELNQYCYSQNASSNVLCTTMASNAPLANGNVTFGASATQYIPPYATTKEYEDILPNVGVSWNFADNQFVYASYAEGLSAPRTDNLYTPSRLASGAIALPGAEPETTKTFDLGYRYQSPMITGQAAIWTTKFENYIVSSFDDVLGIFLDRNVGSVDLWGVEAQVGFEPTENWSIYGFTSYTNSELQDDIPLSATTFLPTTGKQLVETPEWTAGFYVRWEATENLSLSFEGKHVGDRFSTDVNDEATPAYDLYKFGARYDLPFLGKDGSYIQVNVINLFDEEYLGNISSRNNAKTVDVLPGPGVTNRSGSAPSYSVGAPRTLQVTFRANF
ncbi:MAG: TonB-dependent receptor [Caulobacter sp.]|nr:TonB-dependent receptor [Caulobacter sp.]